jgi:hypothetical protein
MKVDYSELCGDGARVNVAQSVPGSGLAGTFQLPFESALSDHIASKGSPAVVQTALQQISGVQREVIAVSRSEADGQSGYTCFWTIDSVSSVGSRGMLQAHGGHVLAGKLGVRATTSTVGDDTITAYAM